MMRCSSEVRWRTRKSSGEEEDEIQLLCEKKGQKCEEKEDEEEQ